MKFHSKQSAVQIWTCGRDCLLYIFFLFFKRLKFCVSWNYSFIFFSFFTRFTPWWVKVFSLVKTVWMNCYTISCVDIVFLYLLRHFILQPSISFHFLQIVPILWKFSGWHLDSLSSINLLNKWNVTVYDSTMSRTLNRMLFRWLCRCAR